MIVNWNKKGEVKNGQVFHFQHSLRPFINVSNSEENIFFLDIHEMKFYDFYEIIESEELCFYEDENDDDFLGVEIDGKIEWVD